MTEVYFLYLILLTFLVLDDGQDHS